MDDFSKAYADGMPNAGPKWSGKKKGWDKDDPNDAPVPPPPKDRDALKIGAWLKKEIPPRDWLMGSVMCTGSRWFIYGQTGVGKTLLGMPFGAAVSAGENFLRWVGQRKATVMYLDGELPVETFKERMQLVAKQYGSDIDFYGYNRDDLGELPPLNTVPGQAWLRRELDAIKPDLIIFDSIMCLLIGSLKDEEVWAPVKTFMRELSSRKMAQIWFHHANESGVSYGDKTREWEMDVVVKLSHPVGPDGMSDDEVIFWEWKKTRLKNPTNWQQFQPMAIRLVDDQWEWTEVSGKPGKVTKKSREEIVKAEYVKAYKRLAKEVFGPPEKNKLCEQPKFIASTSTIRDELVSRGFLELKETGGKYPGMTDADRKLLSRVRAELLGDKPDEDGKFFEKDGMTWREMAPV